MAAAAANGGRWKWLGPVMAIVAGEKYFASLQSDLEATGEDAVAIGDSNAVVRVGDCVQMQPRGEIVHVTSLWESVEGQKKAEVRYFCRAEAALSSKELVNVDPVATAQSLERVSFTHWSYCNGMFMCEVVWSRSSWSPIEWVKWTWTDLNASFAWPMGA